MKDILKKYICQQPFNYLDVQLSGDYLCCPSWCPTNIRENEPAAWNSEAAKSVRRSILDGSYSHCQHEICPSLSEILHTGKVPHNFVTHEEFRQQHNVDSTVDLMSLNYMPEEILFGFDRSCNLKCPSCRPSVVPNDEESSPAHLNKLKILNLIEAKYAVGVKRLLITGSGDPFYSKIYRNYLLNFDKSKYEKIERIHLITNAQLLNKKTWETMAAKNLVESMEISIDAGTAITYETQTRLGGTWSNLLENLRFISTIKDNFNFLLLSMVVSEKNFTEMKLFYDLMNEIFKESQFSISVNFRQHVHWGDGKYTEKEVENMQVFRPEHPKFLHFKDELMKIHNLPNTNHNFHHLIT